jgi:hypothetical protein
VQRPLTSGPGGGGPAKSPGWPARFYVSLACGFMDMCLHEKGKAKATGKVGGGLSTWPAGRHMASYRLGQVGGAPPRPYKYPPTGGNQNTHHILEIPLAKLPFLV